MKTKSKCTTTSVALIQTQVLHNFYEDKKQTIDEIIKYFVNRKFIDETEAQDTRAVAIEAALRFYKNEDSYRRQEREMQSRKKNIAKHFTWTARILEEMYEIAAQKELKNEIKKVMNQQLKKNK
jgi:hypothetical protein